MAPTLHLASSSPRRRSLLTDAGIPHVDAQPGPEVDGEGAPVERARQRARSKALGAWLPGVTAGLVLGVDTVVECDGRELPKPTSRTQAAAFLGLLAGRDHLVHTAQCLVSRKTGSRSERVATARVRFAPLDDAAIERYLETQEWEGKAGGYAIQGHAGAFATVVEGDLDTVIGLSVATLRAQMTALDGNPEAAS